MTGVGPGGCATYTAEVDGITSTNPQRADSDNDGLNDSYEALILLTDPTSSDTDNDGIPDGVEVNGLHMVTLPKQATLVITTPMMMNWMMVRKIISNGV